MSVTASTVDTSALQHTASMVLELTHRVATCLDETLPNLRATKARTALDLWVELDAQGVDLHLDDLKTTIAALAGPAPSRRPVAAIVVEDPFAYPPEFDLGLEP